jgi:uncharacterized protein YajQ (UPF0234 family)
MPSFDTVCEPNMVKIKNAVENAGKEIGTRFDFKGTAAAIELKDKEKEIVLTGDADFQLQQGDVQKIGGDKVKQVVKVRSGIASEDAKKIQKLIKDSKLKVQASIQGDAVRVTGKDRDVLQQAIALLRKEMADLPLTYNNFRD